MQAFNPNAEFDIHCLGGGTEDVLPGWPYKGNWTSKPSGILSMYMLAEGLDAEELLEVYGSISVDWNRKWAGAIDTLDQVEVSWEEQKVVLTARNMISTIVLYTIKIFGKDLPNITIDGQPLSDKQKEAGFPVEFGPNQKKSITTLSNGDT